MSDNLVSGDSHNAHGDKLMATKYNKWLHREPLIFDGSLTEMARRSLVATNSTQVGLERDILYQQEFTQQDGIEFVAFSSTRSYQPLHLPNAVEIRPCFQPPGGLISEPQVHASTAMHQRGRFIYDGWMPWSDWIAEGAANASQKINEAFSLLGAVGHAPFTWQTKYRLDALVPSRMTEIDDNTRSGLALLTNALDKISDQQDRDAIMRCIGWMDASHKASNPLAQFLFAIVSIESLAFFVSEKSKGDLAKLAPKKQTKSQRRKTREQCIKETLDAEHASLTEAVQAAYFNCITGSGKMLKAHLSKVLGDKSIGYKIMFGEDDKSGLYDLRHTIAHGSVNSLRESDVYGVASRVHEAQLLAQVYLHCVLGETCDYQPDSSQRYISVPTNMLHGLISNRAMYKGPTHMGIVYLNELA